MSGDKAQPNPNRFYCPHCGTENPPYGWNFNGGDLGIAGQVSYVTIYCAAVISPATVDGTPEQQCRKVLGVSLLGYQPGPALLQEARRLGLKV